MDRSYFGLPRQKARITSKKCQGEIKKHPRSLIQNLGIMEEKAKKPRQFPSSSHKAVEKKNGEAVNLASPECCD